MREINIRYKHGIHPDLFDGVLKEALQRLLTGDWVGFNVSQCVSAINSLYDGLRESVAIKSSHPHTGFKNLRQKIATMTTSEDIRRCMYALGEVWAILWFNRGKFVEKREFYEKKFRSYELKPLDEVFLQGLQKLGAEIERDK
jgi:hypothetical protein